MVFYNKILRVWMVDPLDYFILSAIIGSILASSLKDHVSEKECMERLKNSIIEKSKLVVKSTKSFSNSRKRKIKIKRIYKFAIENRGGQLEDLQVRHEFSNEIFKLAQEIKKIIERLAVFLKQQELKGIANIFFKNGRLILELILYKCKIDLSYAFLGQGISRQVIVMTTTVGGAAGFTLAWFSAGSAVVITPMLITTLLLRSVMQQIVNQLNYIKFKKLVTRMLEDDELKQTIQTFFIETEVPRTNAIKIKPLNSNKNVLPEFNFESDQTFEQFIESTMKEELGVIENPISQEIEKVIQNKKIRNKGKTVYFKDFIKDEIEALDDFIDVEIVKEDLKIKVKNE